MPQLDTKCSDPNCTIKSGSCKSDKQSISCNSPFCQNTFHLICAGLKDKNVSDLYFLCKACHDFITYTHAPFKESLEKLEKKIDNICATLNTRISTLEDKVNSSISTLNNQISLLEQENARTNSKFESINAMLDQLKCSKSDVTLPNIETDATVPPLNSEGNNNEDKISAKKEKNTNSVYLCSIEKSLQKSDVINILQIENIYVENIDFEMPSGNFKNKYYLHLNSDQAINIFRFKTTFMHSKLYNTWFLKDSPPRQPTFAKQQYNKPPTHSNFHYINNNYTDKRNFKNFDKTQNQPNNNRATTSQFKPSNSNYKKSEYVPNHKSSYTHKYSEVVNNGFRNEDNGNDYIDKKDFQYFLEEVLKNVWRR